MQSKQAAQALGAKSSGKPGLAQRQAAASILFSVLEGSVFEPLTAQQVPDERDRAFSNKLVTQALRRHQQLSLILDESLQRGLPQKSGIFEAALRIGLTELLFMDAQADHAATYLCVEMMRADKRSRRFDKLANGVLRQAQRDMEKLTSLPSRTLFAPDFAEHIERRFGEDGVNAFADALLQGAPLDLTCVEDAKAFADTIGGVQLNGQSVRLLARDRKVVDLDGYQRGAFFVQDVAAALPAMLISAPAGARVLDLCAAPGGKTAQLSLAGYKVVAVDNDARRMARVRENIQRLGLEVELRVEDVLKLEDTDGFDAILLDAPCSATGTFRRHPEVLINRERGDVDRLVGLQRKMLRKALTLLRPEGVLTYCVCSLDEAEAERQAKWAVAQLDVEIVPITTPDFGGVLGAVDAQGCLRTHAGLGFAAENQDEVRGMDGFFAVRLKKCALKD